jgi:SAV_6107-like HEPN
MTTATITRPAAGRSAASTSNVLRPSRVAPVAAVRLMVAAQRALGEATAATNPLERYASAHLAALRAAAAVLADRARPTTSKPRRPTSAWTLLVGVAPEMEPWAAYFASGANKRAAAEAGLRGAVTTREADDLLRDAAAFIGVVETTLGMLSLGGSSGSDAANDVAVRHRRQ